MESLLRDREVYGMMLWINSMNYDSVLFLAGDRNFLSERCLDQRRERGHLERGRERERNLDKLKLTSVFDKSGTLFIRIVIREYLVYDVIQRRINF